MAEKKLVFDRNKEWPFKKAYGIRYSPNRQKNTELFVFWMGAKLQEAYGKPLQPGERLNCQAMSYSEANDLFLKSHIGPMAHIEFSPKTDAGLLDSELVIETDDLIRCDCGCSTGFYMTEEEALKLKD